ncbi:unnamed protein product [Danaus chrysippus]|uniref:(African queen) hypothetical protein n=1 Tax=Danaus chrysippus TaxID=151541 RepID=A0A8J2R551_9NEOP|nr:unnamed protein product [Danaus chrysippus]
MVSARALASLWERRARSSAGTATRLNHSPNSAQPGYHYTDTSTTNTDSDRGSRPTLHKANGLVMLNKL